ncbi:hypothetical protein HDE_05428 [Halotydeus destructor]|nr:hypothetical protein HDE_05428 [Halotydeus destructor]
MIRELDIEDQLDLINEDLHQFLEVESVAKLRSCLKSIRSLHDEIAVYSDKFVEQKQALNSELEYQLELDINSGNPVDVLEYASGVVNKERHVLELKTSELNSLLKQKAELLVQFRNASSKFDAKKAQLKDLDRQFQELNDSELKFEHKRLSKLMLTVYKMDSQSRCVSLILDKENFVERAVLVDKENKPEDAVREEIWSEFEKLYIQDH